MAKKNDPKELAKPEEEKLLEHTEPKEIAAGPSEKLLSAAKEQALPSLTPEAKAKEYEDILKRLGAEFDNYRKRVEKDRLDRARFESEGMVKKLLPFLDDFDGALDAAEKSSDTKLAMHISVLREKLLSILKADGLSEMQCLGEKFDPYLHEAVLHEASDKDDGTVIRVVRKGYRLHEKILRHAMVAVSNGKKS